MGVFLDLKGYRLGHYGGTPNLRTNTFTIPFTFDEKIDWGWNEFYLSKIQKEQLSMRQIKTWQG